MTTSTSVRVPHAEFFPAPAEAGAITRFFGMMAQDARELVRFWPVVQNMVAQDLRVRYQRSVLGFLWTLLNPILMMGTMAVVFTHLFGFPSAMKFAVYLFAGMVPWSLFSGSLFDCAVCIVGNEGLIRKIYIPKLVFPLSRVLLHTIMVGLSMGSLFVLMIPLGARFSLPMVMLPVAIVLFAVFTLGLGMVLSVVNTFYRDAGHLISVVVQAWYFLTPIMYPEAQLPAEIRWRFWLNPVYPFIRVFQLIVSEGEWPGGMLLLVTAGLASVSLGVGYAVFKTYEDKLIFRL